MYSGSANDPENSTQRKLLPSIKFLLPGNNFTKLRLNSTPLQHDQGLVGLEHKVNPLMDMYQMGRAVNGGNDFIVPGMLHVDDEGCSAGPISRWACRIECERLPPFRCFIYAGAFDPINKV